MLLKNEPVISKLNPSLSKKISLELLDNEFFKKMKESTRENYKKRKNKQQTFQLNTMSFEKAQIQHGPNERSIYEINQSEAKQSDRELWCDLQTKINGHITKSKTSNKMIKHMQKKLRAFDKMQNKVQQTYKL